MVIAGESETTGGRGRAKRALVASACALLYLALFDEHLNYTDSIMLAVGVMALLLFYRHSQNIGKLLSGKESKIGSKAKKA